MSAYEDYGMYCEVLIQERIKEKEIQRLREEKIKREKEITLKKFKEYLEIAKEVPQDIDTRLNLEINYFLNVIFPQILDFYFKSTAVNDAVELENVSKSTKEERFNYKSFSIFYSVKDNEQIQLINLDNTDNSLYIMPEYNEGELFKRFNNYIVSFLKEYSLYNQGFSNALQFITSVKEVIKAYELELKRFNAIKDDLDYDLGKEQEEYLNSHRKEYLWEELETFKQDNAKWLNLKKVRNKCIQKR